MDPDAFIQGDWYVSPGRETLILRYEGRDGDGYIFSVFKGKSPESTEELLRVITIHNVTPLEPWTAGSA